MVGGCPPPSVLLLSFLASVRILLTIIRQRLVVHLLSASIHPHWLPMSPASWGGSGCFYSRTRSFPLQTRRMDKYSPL